MSGPPDRQDSELKIHSLFQALRAQSIDVARGFSERVRARLHEVEDTRTQPPAPRSIFAATLVEFLNLLTGAFGGRSEREPRDDP